LMTVLAAPEIWSSSPVRGTRTEAALSPRARPSWENRSWWKARLDPSARITAPTPKFKPLYQISDVQVFETNLRISDQTISQDKQRRPSSAKARQTYGPSAPLDPAYQTQLGRKAASCGNAASVARSTQQIRPSSAPQRRRTSRVPTGTERASGQFSSDFGPPAASRSCTTHILAEASRRREAAAARKKTTPLITPGISKTLRSLPEQQKAGYCAMGMCGHAGAVKQDKTDNLMQTPWRDLRKQRLAGQ